MYRETLELIRNGQTGPRVAHPDVKLPIIGAERTRHDIDLPPRGAN